MYFINVFINININTKMEVRRRVKQNKIINDIRDIELFINRSNDTISRIKGSNTGVEYIKNQIIKLTEAVSEKEDCLNKLNNLLLDIKKGNLDIELEQESNEIKEKNELQTIKNIEKKKEKKKEKEKKSAILDTYWQNTISSSRNQKQIERDIKYYNKYFNKICNSLPSYMIKNLSEMSNNNGYIWRGVNFYGDLPVKPGFTTMFEKNNSNLIIHEYSNTEYKRYEKEGKNPKQLVFNETLKSK